MVFPHLNLFIMLKESAQLFYISMREEHDLLIAPTSVRNADESLAKLSEEMTQNKQKREEQDWMVWGPPKSLVDFMENPTKIWLEKMENASMKSING